MVSGSPKIRLLNLGGRDPRWLNAIMEHLVAEILTGRSGDTAGICWTDRHVITVPADKDLALVDVDYCRGEDISIVRTFDPGGLPIFGAAGTVYIMLGSDSLYSSVEEAISDANYFVSVVLHNLGVESTSTGNDVLVDGRKLAGTLAYRLGDYFFWRTLVNTSLEPELARQAIFNAPDVVDRASVGAISVNEKLQVPILPQALASCFVDEMLVHFGRRVQQSTLTKDEMDSANILFGKYADTSWLESIHSELPVDKLREAWKAERRYHSEVAAISGVLTGRPYRHEVENLLGKFQEEIVAIGFGSYEEYQQLMQEVFLK